VSIKDQISADMKNAMREKDKKKVSVLRMILSELQYAKTSAGSDGSELDDKAVLKVVASYHKRLKKSLGDFPEGEKRDEIQFEMDIAEVYLPKKASEEETTKIVKEVLAENEGAHFGVVMKAVLAKMGDSADGGLVSRVIKSLQG
jgi:uncharacterized protein YqeY